jgi:cytochrome c oxidase cbb3-type subunit 2
VTPRLTIRRWPLLAAALLLWPLSGLAQEPPSADRLARELERLEAERARQALDAEVREGARLFARACAACHGRQGAGDGPAAADLDPAPRDLQSGKIRFRTTPSGSPPRPEDLERTIRRGLPGSSMPAFDDLFSAREIDQLVAFITSLQPASELPPLADIPAELPAASPELAREGHALYHLLECWRCHGVNGSGRGPSSAGLTDDTGRTIRATDLRFDPFKGGRDPAAVVRTLVTGLNGTPMPAYGDALVFPREATPDPTFPDWPLTDTTRAELAQFVHSMPDAAALDAMSAAEREALRQRRLAALAHYVLGLDRRGGARYWLLHAQPEREGRAH